MSRLRRNRSIKSWPANWKSTEYKARLRHKDGRWIWIQDRGKVVAWSRKGKPLVMSGTHTDITLEQTLTEKIRMQNERFMRLVDSLPEIVYELDLEQKHTAVYGKWLKDLQADSASFLGKTAREMFGADAAPHEKAFDRVLKGETVVYDWHMTIRGRTVYYQDARSRRSSVRTAPSWPPPESAATSAPCAWRRSGSCTRTSSCSTSSNTPTARSPSMTASSAISM
ncbi:MAG: PAS domain-containing protein [Bacillus subtilis]|nr:PAS domain-containing protein [Bacillus subtilis]